MAHPRTPIEFMQLYPTITLDAHSHTIPAMQEEEAALIAGLMFAGE